MLFHPQPRAIFGLAFRDARRLLTAGADGVTRLWDPVEGRPLGGPCLHPRPLKLLECLATGLPTVSIDIPEVRAFEPHLRVAQTIDDFIQVTREAIREPEFDSLRLSRQQAVKGEGWDCRAVQLDQLLRWVHQGHAGAAPIQPDPTALHFALNANSVA